MKAQLESVSAGRFRVGGMLDAVTVVQILEESNRLFAGVPQIEVDLAGVSESDSSGLALLLEWMRLARLKEQQIRFRNVPTQISALAHISEVEELLGVDDDEPAVIPPGTALAS